MNSESKKASFFEKVLAFVKKNAVVCIALLAAIITSFIIPVETLRSRYSAEIFPIVISPVLAFILISPVAEALKSTSPVLRLISTLPKLKSLGI